MRCSLRVRLACLTPILGALSACAGAGDPADGVEAWMTLPVPGIGAAQEARYREDLATLSSDAFEGRGPASPGEEQTVAHLIRRFEEAGLRPGNGDSWVQEVPLVAIRAMGAAPLEVSSPEGGSRTLAFGPDQVTWTKRVVEEQELRDSELVFVGYGVVAPEFGWNDYEGVDMAGKTAVILVNDPGYITGDEDRFRGRAMTYYGRWTYKLEEAARQGAAGALIVHETGAAAYPWETVLGSWTGPQFTLASSDDNMGRVAVEGWLSNEAARALIGARGGGLDSLWTAAAQPGFRAFSLEQRASIRIGNEIRRSVSPNVLGLLPGRERPDEWVVYMAHWDHFGRTPDFSGDPIFNGAVDNATGTAGLLEMARIFGALAPEDRPARSILFLAVAAEEQGLLGSAWYAGNPVHPRHATVAALNMDVLDPYGPTSDVTVIGLGNSELDQVVEVVAGELSLDVGPDPRPEQGSFYRSDHFSFAKEGVPALYLSGGTRHRELGPEYIPEQRARFTAERYHKPSDEYDPAWDLRGALQSIDFLYRIGYRVAESDAWPNWYPGTEFRSRRDMDRAGHEAP